MKWYKVKFFSYLMTVHDLWKDQPTCMWHMTIINVPDESKVPVVICYMSNILHGSDLSDYLPALEFLSKFFQGCAAHEGQKSIKYKCIALE